MMPKSRRKGKRPEAATESARPARIGRRGEALDDVAIMASCLRGIRYNLRETFGFIGAATDLTWGGRSAPIMELLMIASQRLDEVESDLDKLLEVAEIEDDVAAMADANAIP